MGSSSLYFIIILHTDISLIIYLLYTLELLTMNFPTLNNTETLTHNTESWTAMEREGGQEIVKAKLRVACAMACAVKVLIAEYPNGPIYICYTHAPWIRRYGTGIRFFLVPGRGHSHGSAEFLSAISLTYRILSLYTQFRFILIQVSIFT